MYEVLIVIFAKLGEEKNFFFPRLESFCASLTTLFSHQFFGILFSYHLSPHCSTCDRFAEAQ